jgi:adenine-specific DNA-methyltransferase
LNKLNSRFSLQYPEKQSENSIIDNTKPSNLKLLRVYGKSSESWNNLLIQGDNLNILSTLASDPKFKGKIKLIYIDPPFGTGQNFNTENDLNKSEKDAYPDELIGYEFLEFLRKRIVLMKELLADDGSIYVHLDQRMAHYVKIIMDEIFGINNFRSWITRKKCNPKGFTRKNFGNIQDFILFYTKSKNFIWNKPLDPLTPEKIISSEYRYVEDDTNRIFKKVPIHAPGERNGETGKPWRGMKPPKGKHWQWMPSKLEAFDKEGRIYWSKNGNPRLKIYLDERKGIAVQDIWLNFLDPMNQHTSKTDYPTEKNQLLLERIIKCSTNEDDIVLDCFVGSGTTLSAATILGRKWIGVDRSSTAIKTSIKRLKQIQTERKEQIDKINFQLYHSI